MWLDRSLAGAVLTRQVLDSEDDPHLEAALLVATLAAAGYTQATVSYAYGTPPPAMTTRHLRYGAWRGSTSGPMTRVLEQLFALYHPGYLHADPRAPRAGNTGLREVAVVAARQTRWQETQPLSAMRFNAAMGRGSARARALAAGELLPVREWHGRPWGRPKSANQPWRGFHSFLSMHTPEYVPGVQLLRFVFEAPPDARAAGWHAALRGVWDALRRHATAVVHVSGDGHGRREFWLWVRHLGSAKSAAEAPDAADVASWRRTMPSLTGGADGSCFKLVQGCTDTEPCWLPTEARRGGLVGSGTTQAKLVRWAYKPLEPDVMRKVVMTAVVDAAGAAGSVASGHEAQARAWVCRA